MVARRFPGAGCRCLVLAANRQVRRGATAIGSLAYRGGHCGYHHDLPHVYVVARNTGSVGLNRKGQENLFGLPPKGILLVKLQFPVKYINLTPLRHLVT